jgi:hypothetical protein
MSEAHGATVPQTTVARIRELNEAIISAAGDAGSDYLASYEQMLAELVDLQKQVASSNPLGWVTTLAGSQVKFVQRISAAFTAAARSSLT